MTQEHVTITEEVQMDGNLVTIERETLHTERPEPGAELRTQAYGVTHPGYVSAEDRVYAYNEATGMSESTAAEPEPEPSEVLPEPEADEEDEAEDEDEEEADEDETETATCLHPVGSGFCQLEAGHAGAHRLNVD